MTLAMEMRKADRWAVFSGGFQVGTIERPEPDGTWRWQISTVLMGDAPIDRHGGEPTRDEALAALTEAWRAWLALAGLEHAGAAELPAKAA